MKRLLRGLGCAGVVLLGLFVAAFFLGNGMVFPFGMAGHLMLGWAWYLGDTLPQVRPSVPVLVETAIVVVVLGVGLHWFLGWFVRERYRTAWTPARTAAVLGGIVLMFTTSIASAGLAHQTAWLGRAPLTETSWFSKRDATDVLDSACRRADWSSGVMGLSFQVGHDPLDYELGRFHYVFAEEDDRNLLFVFPRDPVEQALYGGQKCLEVDAMPHAIPVPPEELAEHIADPWLGTY